MAFLRKKETGIEVGGKKYIATAAVTDNDLWPNFMMVEEAGENGAIIDTVFQDVSDDPEALFSGAASAILAWGSRKRFFTTG